jgi:monoamine oxidase
MKMPNVIKCIAFYAKPFWRQNGLSGESMSNQHPIRFTFDNCAESAYSLVCFIMGDQAKILSSTMNRKQLVLNHLERLFGEEAKDIIHYEDKDWTQDFGAYFGIATPNTFVNGNLVLQDPFGRVLFAGIITLIKWRLYWRFYRRYIVTHLQSVSRMERMLIIS